MKVYQNYNYAKTCEKRLSLLRAMLFNYCYVFFQYLIYCNETFMWSSSVFLFMNINLCFVNNAFKGLIQIIKKYN